MKITASEAEAFFAHPSQRKGAMLDGPLPEGLDYFACEGVCGVFHWGHWPGVLMAHVGAKPEAWGRSTSPSLSILREAWAHFEPERIVAFVKEGNRATCRFAERLGFQPDGRIPLAEPVMIYGWRLECL